MATRTRNSHALHHERWTISKTQGRSLNGNMAKAMFTSFYIGIFITRRVFHITFFISPFSSCVFQVGILFLLMATMLAEFFSF